MKVDDIDGAKRLARAMASDICIYNTDKIKRGLENDSVFDELSSDLKEADQTWKSRVPEEIRKEHNIFQRIFIDVLFGTHAKGEYPIF
jgi:hypothetical protein